MTTRDPQSEQKSEYAQPLRRGLVLGAAVLAVVLPPAYLHFAPKQQAKAPVAAAPLRAHRAADLRGEPASDDVRRLAAWIADSGDNGTHAFAILDKQQARVFLFEPDAHLRAAASALLGSWKGDDTVPGVGDKPIKDVLPEEKTTPAGRFVAKVGESSSRGEDVVWVDYDAAVSMHRIIKVPERLKAMATPDVHDNRMSFGCINLPDAFYEGQLRPAIDRSGLIVYVLPETRPIAKTFASFYEVDAAMKVAQH